MKFHFYSYRRTVAPLAIAAFLASAGAYAHGNAPGKAGDQGAMNQSSDQIRDIQSKLNEKGYTIGSVDGVMGPKTSQAIKKFQRDQGEAATGKLDQSTLSSLGVQAANDTMSGTQQQSGTSGQQSESGKQQSESSGQQSGYSSQPSGSNDSQSGSSGQQSSMGSSSGSSGSSTQSEGASSGNSSS